MHRNKKGKTYTGFAFFDDRNTFIGKYKIKLILH